jgi:AcrR family transcriptional regulator
LKKATSDAILDAAEAALSDEGVHAARMEDVAARAGVSVGTLYNYFADRAALIEALVLSRREALVDRLDQALVAVEGKRFEQQLERFLGELFAHFEQHRRFFSILMQGELGIRKSPNEALRAIHTRVELLVRRGTASGELRKPSAAVYPAP